MKFHEKIICLEWSNIPYWFLLLSTNICNSRFDFDIYLTIQSFRCNRTLISGVSITTGTILKYKRSKAQKVKVVCLLQPLSLQKHMKHLLWKNSNWILQFSPSPSPPLLLPLPWVPPYWGPKASSYGPSWFPPSVAPISYPLTLEGEAADGPHNFRDSPTEPREQGHLLHTPTLHTLAYHLISSQSVCHIEPRHGSLLVFRSRVH